MARIGLFGGSFDPVHIGHLWIAQDAIEQAQLDRLLFIPATQAPLRENSPFASGDLRLKMLRAATNGDPRFAVITDELDRGGTSYTIDTVAQIRRKFPDDELFWLIGADQISRLNQWKKIEDLAKQVTFLGFERLGESGVESCLPDGIRLKMLSRRRCDISSSEIRERCRSSLPIHFFLPNNVDQIIQSESLYRGDS